MSISEAKLIWRDGELVPWAEATTHVLSHGLHYGTSMFEGIRVYDTPNGPCGFRLADHVARLFASAQIYAMEIPYSHQELVEACHETVQANDLSSAYLRPIAFYGYGEIGVAPGPAAPVNVAIAAFPWGAYLGEEGRANGVDVCVSSWRRPAPGTIPMAAKAAGNYLSGFLISREAKRNGYAEGIALDVDGRLSEGAGENLFIVRDGMLLTPPASASILSGITRDSVIKLAAQMGIKTREEALPREILYVADELFFTGTAAEITPIRSVDGRATKANGCGPITKALQDRFFGLFTGKTADVENWLEPISQTTRQEKDNVVKVAV
ncbi:MAG: branched chain amino acid aminotransferase [Robiginitomaculum sp.]|nr:MAG: branched chain amino acid aminotransferase [Robiginitomaculum sp.]